VCCCKVDDDDDDPQVSFVSKVMKVGVSPLQEEERPFSYFLFVFEWNVLKTPLLHVQPLAVCTLSFFYIFLFFYKGRKEKREKCYCAFGHHLLISPPPFVPLAFHPSPFHTRCLSFLEYHYIIYIYKEEESIRRDG